MKESLIGLVAVSVFFALAPLTFSQASETLSPMEQMRHSLDRSVVLAENLGGLTRQTLEKCDDILEGVKQLRWWAHRNPRGGSHS